MKNKIFKLGKTDFCVLRNPQGQIPYLQFLTPHDPLDIEYTGVYDLIKDCDIIQVIFLPSNTLILYFTFKNKVTIKECTYEVSKQLTTLSELTFEVECRTIVCILYKKSLQCLIVATDCGSVLIFMLYKSEGQLKSKLIKRFKVTNNYIVGVWLVPESFLREDTKHSLSSARTELCLNNFLKHVLVVIDVFGSIIMYNTTDSSPFFVKENNILMEVTCAKLKKKMGLLFFSPFLVRKTNFSHLFCLYTKKALNSQFVQELKEFVNTFPCHICITSMDFAGKVMQNKVVNRIMGKGCFDKNIRLACIGGLNNNQFFILFIHKHKKNINTKHKFFDIEEREDTLVATLNDEISGCDIEKEQYVYVKHSKDKSCRSIVFTNETGKIGVISLNNIGFV